MSAAGGDDFRVYVNISGMIDWLCFDVRNQT